MTTVAFRVDASAQIGTGHVMRCLTLAEELRTGGVESRFICRENPGNLIAAILERSFPVTQLPESGPEQAADALHGIDPDWLVVDHYGLDVEWERRLRPRVGRLLAIDDLADRTHDCDLLLDQNYSVDAESRYASLVPRPCIRLIGPHYALLAPPYSSARRMHPRDVGTVRRVLIYFGGVNPSNMSGQALAALSAPEFSGLQIDLVIGTNHAQRQALTAQAAGRPGTCVHGTRRHLVDLMLSADVAIGAGGVTTWERMCLGLPSLVVSVSENQRPTCEALADDGRIEYVGDHRSVGAAQIRDAFSRLLHDRGRMAMLSSLGQQLVDGRGASRVAGVMLAAGDGNPIRKRNALHEADVRPAGFDTFVFAWIDRCPADEVLALRNMPHVREQMRSHDPVDPDAHHRFLEDYGRLDRYDFALIDTSRNLCVGVFYVTNLGSTPEIGKYIGNRDYIGKGIARRATQSILDFCRSKAGLHHLTATTRRDNPRNIALNAKLGFTQSGTEGEFVVMALDLSSLP